MSDASVTIVLILLIGIAVIGGVFFLRLFLRWIDMHTVPAVYTPQRVAEEKAKVLRTLEAAHGAYEGSLAALKEQPANPNFRQEALRLGRIYSSLTRQSGATAYDELALANDISAACAAAASRSGDPPEERLATLAELKGRGLISEEEFNLKRQAILKEL
jgi:putative oligomerization/nucleic acid binding protein